MTVGQRGFDDVETGGKCRQVACVAGGKSPGGSVDGYGVDGIVAGGDDVKLSALDSDGGGALFGLDGPDTAEVNVTDGDYTAIGAVVAYRGLSLG